MREEQIVRWEELEQSPLRTIAREARGSNSQPQMDSQPLCGEQSTPAKTSWATVTDDSFIF